ncbi:DUF3304 domain-containing protein [Methylovorus mays]|uniref:DUF3304 domain-containing protein n=2 Tax=Methylovorus mays TaxID=184077 RepID=UPI001E579800|nr:DUF3304 domain-containing protein [Methylovorus mays]MCB5206625.1 DUF3304 domain-containing protein [Methylovorus mays]
MKKPPQKRDWIMISLMILGAVILMLGPVGQFLWFFILRPLFWEAVFALQRNLYWIVLIASLCVFIFCLYDMKIRRFFPWHGVVMALCLGGGTFAIMHIHIEEPTWEVSYGAVNHTDKSIVSIIINGEGGILHVTPHTVGTPGICCVIVPQRWRPGLTATIKWREAGHWATDAAGKVIYEDSGLPLLIEAPWKTRTVPIPQYISEGAFYVFFYPNDEVRVALTSTSEYLEWEEETPEDAAYQAKEYAQ